MAGRELTSDRSPRVKAARRLAKRTFRARERRFLAEGPQAVREAINGEEPGSGLTELFTTADAELRHRELVAAAEARGVPVYRVGAEVMAELAQTVTPQGLLGVCEFLDISLTAAMSVTPRLMTVLAHVRDPGNAGTVLRASDAAGADGVIFTDASVDPYNGKCVRASAGSLFHLPVVVGPRFADVVGTARAAGLRVVAADGAGHRTLDEALDDGSLGRPTMWVFGNEAWGLPPAVLDAVDDVIRVPIHGRAESLNLATAAAVCLYASARAQRAVPGSPAGRREPPDHPKEGD